MAAAPMGITTANMDQSSLPSSQSRITLISLKKFNFPIRQQYNRISVPRLALRKGLFLNKKSNHWSDQVI